MRFSKVFRKVQTSSLYQHILLNEYIYMGSTKSTINLVLRKEENVNKRCDVFVFGYLALIINKERIQVDKHY